MQHALTIIGDILIILTLIAIVGFGIVCLLCFAMNKPGGGPP